MNILLLEDEPKVATFIGNAIKSDLNFKVHHIASIDELQNCNAQYDHFDLAIFDRMIGNHDSLNSLKEFKIRFPRCPILILSAINSPDERAQALNLGADDYMGKPYSLIELQARIKVLLRRDAKESIDRSSFSIGEFILDCVTRKVTFCGDKIDLSAKEFQLLLLLIKKPGQVFSKNQILNQVWDVQSEIESNVVETTIRNIRRKLEDHDVTFKISSQRNVGYWIET